MGRRLTRRLPALQALEHGGLDPLARNVHGNVRGLAPPGQGQERLFMRAPPEPGRGRSGPGSGWDCSMPGWGV